MQVFPPFLVRDEAHDRAKMRNMALSNALDDWQKSNEGHSVRVVWLLEKDFGANYLTVRVEGENAAQVAQVQAIIERLFVKTLVQPSEIL